MPARTQGKGRPTPKHIPYRKADKHLNHPLFNRMAGRRRALAMAARRANVARMRRARR